MRRHKVESEQQKSREISFDLLRNTPPQKPLSTFRGVKSIKSRRCRPSMYDVISNGGTLLLR